MEDEELFQGLLTHLSPTITRLQHDLPIYNPLLSQIQTEYRELYEQTKQACRVLENYCGVSISADETGFITMHIGASLERMQHTAIHRRVIPIGVVLSLIHILRFFLFRHVSACGKALLIGLVIFYINSCMRNYCLLY